MSKVNLSTPYYEHFELYQGPEFVGFEVTCKPCSETLSEYDEDESIDLMDVIRVVQQHIYERHTS